ncbi:MAG: polysaccharide biosynthesis tyrosine autokinase [Pseudomonadota bacterium]
MNQQTSDRSFKQDIERLNESLPSAETVDFERVIGAIRANLALIIITFLVGVILASVYLIFAKEKYAAYSQVVIKSPSTIAAEAASQLRAQAVDEAIVETEIAAISSSRILSKVISDHLTEADPDYKTVQKKANLANDGTSISYLVQAFRKKIDIERIGESQGIQIRVSSSNPQVAAKLANALAEIYVADEFDRRLARNEKSRSVLSARISKLGQQIINDERRAIEYRQANGLTSERVESGSLADSSLKAMSDELTTVSTALAKAELRLKEIDAHKKRGGPLQATPTMDQDAEIISLSTKLSETERDIRLLESQFASSLLKTDTEYRRLEVRQRSIIRALESAVNARRNTLVARIEVLSGQKRDLQSRINEGLKVEDQLDRSNTVLMELERGIKSKKQQYDALVFSLSALSANEGVQSAGAEVVSPALTPIIPYAPNKKLTLAAAGILFGLIGTGIALFRDYLSGALRTSDELAIAIDRKPIVFLPKVSPTLFGSRYRSRRRRRSKTATDTPQSNSFPIIDRLQSKIMILTGYSDDLSSQSAEIFRNKVSILLWRVLRHAGSESRVISLTSSVQGEGKSTLAPYLAAGAAELGKKVLIIDGDLRTAQLSKSLRKISSRVKTPNGLHVLLKSDCPIDDAIISAEKSGLPFASLTMKMTGDEDLCREFIVRLPTLIEELRARFDVIIFDAPPILPVLDGRAISSESDVVILAVRWNSTRAEVLKQCYSEMRSKFSGGEIFPVYSMVDMRRLAGFAGETGKPYAHAYEKVGS